MSEIGEVAFTPTIESQISGSEAGRMRTAIILRNAALKELIKYDEILQEYTETHGLTTVEDATGMDISPYESFTGRRSQMDVIDEEVSKELTAMGYDPNDVFNQVVVEERARLTRERTDTYYGKDV